jgi:Flp pilus assembly protein TadD
MFLTAKDGYDTYGCQEPLFLHLYIKGLTERQQFSQAITILDKEIALDPDNDSLYRHRAFVYDYAGDDDASVADYIKAGTLSTDFQTLIEAGKKIAMVGSMKINDINKTDNSDSAKAKKQQIVEMYFNQALAFANKAKAINPDNTNVDLLIENITYDITSNSY